MIYFWSQIGLFRIRVIGYGLFMLKNEIQSQQCQVRMTFCLGDFVINFLFCFNRVEYHTG